MRAILRSTKWKDPAVAVAEVFPSVARGEAGTLLNFLRGETVPSDQPLKTAPSGDKGPPTSQTRFALGLLGGDPESRESDRRHRASDTEEATTPSLSLFYKGSADF
jgi:hypothetical protein